VTAEPIGDIRDTLAEALVRPVRWRETLTALHDLGARQFLEIGPGKVLTGLVRRTLSDVEALVAETEAAHA
jgi:malonyl CoA-acyl carrier protein transacylase